MKRGFIIFYFIIIAVFSVNSQGYNGYTGCALQDSLALVAFYHATDGPDWISNQDGFSISFLSDDVLVYYTTDYPYAGLGKWLEGPVKDWFGVLLEKQQIGDGPDSAWRVVHLHPTLSRRSAGQNDLKGYVPKEVGLLTALKWFKVNGNLGLGNTELPDELYHSTIQVLDFEGCYFSGILSSSLRNCTKLVYPNFRYNNFDSVPVFDFFTEDLWSQLWVYQNRLTWANIEPSVSFLLGKGFEYEARDQHNVGRASEIVVSPGSMVTLTCNDAGANGTCTWYKKGMNTYITGTTYTISSVSASDTGNYTVAIANDYIRLNDANPDYVNTFTKPIHVTFVPSIPVHTNAYTSYSGNFLTVTFSKPMAAPAQSQAAEFTVKRNGEPVTITEISRSGRLNDKFIFNLASSVFNGDSVTIEYVKGTVEDINGGMLNSFTCGVQNLVRKTPNLISAVTREDGESIILEFDQYIDPETLMSSDFSLSGNRSIHIGAITLVEGDIDEGISQSVEIVVNETLTKTDTLSVSYTKGKLCALYGAALQNISDFPVENKVVTSFTTVNLRVIDGTENLSRIVIKGDLKSLPFELFDDGTNGDETAADHIWTKELQLVNGNYNWEVYSRRVVTKYDTSIVVNEFGQTIITITPSQETIDSIISGGSVLNLGIINQTHSGDSVFRFRTNSIVFIVDMKSYLESNPDAIIEPYLMGLNDDWTEGLVMTKVNADTSDHNYTVKVSGYNVGDAVNYTYRNGDIWETYSPRKRSHVVAGNDTARSVFGVWPVSAQKNVLNDILLLYPNPATSSLFISLPGNSVIRNVSIHNITGQYISIPETDQQMINISSFRPGVYIIEVTDMSGSIFRNQFIKIK
jgi:uncharacterized repeat protein (TIGR02059 family)